MMKICIVINHFQISDGVARAAIGAANALTENGQSVTIIPLFKYDAGMLEKLNPAVQVKPVFKFYIRGLTKLIDLVPDKLLYKLIIRDKYDIEIGFCMLLPSKIIAASANSSAKHYIWMHGYDDNLVLRKCYLNVDEVVSVSRFNAEKLLRDIPELGKVSVCHNLIDETDIITKRNEEAELQRDDTPLAVTVGRLSPEKGYDRLISCIYRLKQNGNKLNLWIIGNGPEYEKLVKRTEALKLTDQITFLGEQKNPHKYTKQADFFVCPSYSEGYSTACTEAIILGVPVVSTMVSGAEEITKDSEAGAVVDNDEDALYEELAYLMSHQEIISAWKETLQTTKMRFFFSNRKKELIETLEFRIEGADNIVYN